MRKILLLFLVAAQVSAQELTVKKGMVVDSLKVSDSLSETYSLYLPTQFEGKKTWPVIFLFDGEGRGKATAQLFRTAAEEQGYLLISSNDISIENGLTENLEVAKRLITRAADVFPLDLKMVSAAGSMEGGKVASVIPVIYKDILGAIAVGNHWVNLDFLENDKDFTFIGIAGDEQYTSAGMKYTAQVLKKLRFPSQVYSFEGDKDWPENGTVSSAVGSLTLEAMRKGFRPVDQNLINELFNNDLAHANKMMSNVQLVEAMEFLELMEDKYKGLHELTEVNDKQKEIERSRNYTVQNKEYAEVREKELRLLEDFIFYLGADVQTENYENLGWWNYQKIQLDSLSAKKGPEGKMAKRLIGFIANLAQDAVGELEESHASIGKKLIANIIQTIFEPKSFQAYKNIISLSAQDNDFGTAYFYLEEMLKHGYKNKEALYNIEGTLGLRLTPEYNAIIENYLGTSKYYSD